MPAIAANLTFLGVAKEATRGTPVAASNYLRVDKPQPQDKPNWLEDKGMRGSMVDLYDKKQGTTQSEVSFGGPVFADEFGWSIAGLLGDVVTTGASAPYSHAIATKNNGNGQPTSLTLVDYDGINARAYAGSQITEVGLKFNSDGMLTYTAKAMGWLSSVVSTPTFSAAATTIVPAWLGTSTIAGGNSTIVESCDLTLKRTADVIHTVAGTQNPYQVFVGPISVAGKMTLVMPDDTELARFTGGTTTSLVFDFLQGAGPTTQEVKVTMTKVQYTVGTINRGKQAVRLDVTFDAIANTTDVGASGGYSPCKWTLQNQLAASTYQ